MLRGLGTKHSTPVIVGGVALAVRLAYNFETRKVPFLQNLSGDAASYYAWAQRIAGGEWLGTESFYQAPLYPYVLGAWIAAAGGSVASVRVLQAIWGALACSLTASATIRLFGNRIGMVAGIMLSLYPPAIYFDGIIQKASLDGLLVCILIYLLVRSIDRPMTLAGSVGLGLASGLLCLTRENALVWIPLIAIWVGSVEGSAVPSTEQPDRRTALRRFVSSVGFYFLGVAIILAPVGLRNSALSGAWSFSTFQAGPNFFIGNHRTADGRYQPLVRGHETPDFERTDATRLAEEAVGRKLSPVEVSDYWMLRAVQDIRSDPGRWLRLMGRKWILVWNHYEIADVESPVVYAESSILLRVVGSVWHFGVLCPLAAAGLFVTRPQWRPFWILYAMLISMSLAVALFFVLGRYRYPLVPLLVPFAAVGLCRILLGFPGLKRAARASAAAEEPRPTPLDSGGQGPVHVWAGHVKASTAVPLLIVGITAAVVNWPVQDESRLDALAFANLGAVLGGRGDLEGAVKYLHRAVQVHPQSAEIQFNLGYALSLAGNDPSATRHYRAALALEPRLPAADFLLAQSLERLGERKSALHHFRRAVELDPSNLEAQVAIRRLDAAAEP